MSRFPRNDWKRLNKERYDDAAATIQAGGEPFWRVDKFSSEFLLERHKYRFLRDNSAKGDGQYALEVGCGRGHKTPYLVEGEAELVSFDIAPRTAKLASIRNPSSRHAFLAGDAERLPFASESFDAVYLLSVLHHLSSMQRAIEEASRVSKPGGKVVVFDPNGRSLIAKIVRRLAIRHRHPLYAEEPLAPDEILETLRHNGYTVTAKQLMFSIGYAYPHLVQRVPVPLKWLLYLFLPAIYLIDGVLSKCQHTAWMCGIVARKSRTQDSSLFSGDTDTGSARRVARSR